MFASARQCAEWMSRLTNWLNFSYILDFKLKKKRKHGKSNANGGDLPKKKSGTMRGKTDNHKGKPTIQSIDDIL